MITVLIRAHRRPIQFAKCIQSITNEKLSVIVSGEAGENIAYIFSHVDYIDLFISVSKKPEAFGYNKHCNDLLEKVDSGHCFFLDDDDTIITGSISKLNLQPGKSYIVPFMRGNFEKPDLARRRQKIIQSGYIGLPCLILWHEHKKYINFEATEDADYSVIKHLSTCVNLEWLDISIVRSEKRNFGKMEKENIF